MERFRSVSLPKELLDNVEELIKASPRLGYTSNAHFVGDAVRTHIRVCLAMIKELEKISSKNLPK